MELTMFTKAVLEAVRKIPVGRVTTYSEIARLLGRPKAGRAVGNALNKNPFAPAVSCHRVVKSGGEIGGFRKGTKKKVELLEREGIKIKDGRIVNFHKFFYHF